MASVVNIITSRNNPRVKQLRAALAGNDRLAAGLIGIEGEHLVAEALRSQIPLETVFVAEDKAPPSGLPEGTEVVWLSKDVLASALATETPQGVAALLAPPKLAVPLENGPLLLIAVGLQDPGNLGTLLRSAEAFGAGGVLTTPGTVSAWNQKTMRASAGSVFRVPVQTFSVEQAAWLRQCGVRLLAAVAEGGAAPEQVDLRGGCAIMIGNEGAGLSEGWLAIADGQITLSTPGPVESLNAAVAGSLLLYEACRQRTRVPAGKP